MTIWRGVIAGLVGGVIAAGAMSTVHKSLVGIISGTYSSIFNAAPLVVDWQRLWATIYLSYLACLCQHPVDLFTINPT